MTSRQRFLKTLQREIPDRPPIYVSLTPQIAYKLSKELQLPYEEPLDSMSSTRISHMDLLTHLGADAVGIAACAPESQPSRTDENGIIRNEWGMAMKSIGLYNEFCEYPLSHAETVSDIENYPFPDPCAKGRFVCARMAVDKYGKNFGIIADLEMAFFETAWYLVGLEKFLIDMTLQKPYVESLLDKILSYHIELGKQLLALNPDVLWAGDDFGGQNGMIMSPKTWRSLFKPRIRHMFETFRKIKPDIKLAWHSCGSILPIIPDFIELGLHILNPIQPRAKDMEPGKIKQIFGKDLILFGGVDVQQLFPHGTTGQIREEVNKLIHTVGYDGGYIIAPAHNIQDDTPIENIIAFFDAVTSRSSIKE
jgi:uroporphyrinogen decarboxylase